MANPNLARNLFVASGAAIACLGLTACSGQAQVESPVTTQPSPVIYNSDQSQTTINQTYMPNGTRYTFYSNEYTSATRSARVLAYCDGTSMVEVPLTGYNYAGGAIARTPSTATFHPCDDGRLDPADFETPKK